jgi:hypothetical protein
MTQTVLNVVNLAIGVVLAVLIARMVWAAGEVMLAEAFPRNGALVQVVCRAAVTSFSLISCGYLAMELGIFWTQPNPGVAWDPASTRLEIASLGWLAVFLGLNLFLHLFVLSQVRGRGRRRLDHGGSILA